MRSWSLRLAPLTYACINAFVEGAKAGNEIANNPEVLAEMKTVGGKYAF